MTTPNDKLHQARTNLTDAIITLELAPQRTSATIQHHIVITVALAAVVWVIWRDYSSTSYTVALLLLLAWTWYLLLRQHRRHLDYREHVARTLTNRKRNQVTP